MIEKQGHASDTLDNERTYAADVDMKGDHLYLAKQRSIDEQRAGESAEARADDALAAAAGRAGQT